MDGDATGEDCITIIEAAKALTTLHQDAEPRLNVTRENGMVKFRGVTTINAASKDTQPSKNSTPLDNNKSNDTHTS